MNCVICSMFSGSGFDAAPLEVDPEDLDPLLVERQVDEEHLVEAALADHLGGQQIDAVRGGGHEQAARLLLHPGEEEGEDAALLAAFDSVEVMPISISSNQSTAGAMSSIIRHASTKAPSGLPWRPEKISIMSMRYSGSWKHDAIALTERLLPQPGMPIMSTPLGTISALSVVAHLEELAALQQPLLQACEPADLVEVRSDPR